jgi:hypothetical protein
LEQDDRLFYTGMSVTSIITVFVGFAPTYYRNGCFGLAPLAPLVHVHGPIFASWILLFFAQSVLIARHRVVLHHRLGMAGTGLAVLLVVIGLKATFALARRVANEGAARSLTHLAIPFGSILVFAILTAAGLLYRRRPETHKRLILLATISTLDAAIARWPFAIMKTGPMAWFVVTDLFVLAGVCYDFLSRRHIHVAYVWGGLFLLISQLMRLAIGHTETWLAFIGWLAR